LLVLLSFGAFIFYRNQYSMHNTLWDWIPDHSVLASDGDLRPYWSYVWDADRRPKHI